MKKSSSRVTILRPDAQGNLVPVATAPASGIRRVSALRPIGVWCDLTQNWDAEPSLSYCAVAHDWAVGGHDGSSAPAALGRDGGPAALSSAERAAFSSAQEGAV